jgi:aminomethyltransferase
MEKQTPLYAQHVRLGAKMAPFAGFSMPIQYSGIRQEHDAVRKCAGLFDVSHMGNFFVKGPGARAYLQQLTTNNVSRLHPGDVQYSALCLPSGGVIDDILVYALEQDSFMVVVNASNIQKDWTWFQEHRTSQAFTLEDRSEETTILSLQGPKAEKILRKLTPLPLGDIATYKCSHGKIAGIEMLFARTGYTGEDGFELFPLAHQASSVWEALIEAGAGEDLEPVGLGARDTLRLEAGYSLYGHELSETINPLEAGLGWITDLTQDDFIGREALLKIRTVGLKRKMTGIEMEELAIPREGCEVSVDGLPVGVVTSGTLSPTLGKGIALALVASVHAERGVPLGVNIRGGIKVGRSTNRAFYRRPKSVSAVS